MDLENLKPNKPIQEVSFDPPDDQNGGGGSKLPGSASAGES